VTGNDAVGWALSDSNAPLHRCQPLKSIRGTQPLGDILVTINEGRSNAKPHCVILEVIGNTERLVTYSW
jgi:hypothetical protein